MREKRGREKQKLHLLLERERKEAAGRDEREEGQREVETSLVTLV